MRKGLWLYWAWVFIGLSVVIFLYRLQEREKTKQNKVNARSLQIVFTNLEKRGTNLVKKLSDELEAEALLMPYNNLKLFSRVKNIENNEFYVYVLDHNHSLLAWNTNEYTPTNAEFDTQIGLKKNLTVHKKNLVYYSIMEEIKQQQNTIGYVFLFIPLSKKYSIENRYIQSYSVFDNFTGIECEFVNDIKNTNAFPIHNSAKEYVTSIQIKPKLNYVSDIQKYFVLFVFLWNILLLLAIHHTLKYTLHNRKLATIFFTLFVILLRYGMIYYHFPQNFYSIPLFSPTYYAANNWNASLGDLLINAVLGLILTFEWYYAFLQKHSVQKHIPQKNIFIILFILAIYLVFSTTTYLYQKIVYSVVIHSNIHFDFTNTLKIDEYIVVAVFALMLIFLCFFLIQYWLIGFWIQVYKKEYVLILLVVHIVLIIINTFLLPFTQNYLLWWIIPSYLVLLTYIRYHTEYKQKLFFAFNHSLGLVFIFGLNLATHIHYFWQEKQNQEQVQFALRKAKQHDEILESVYNEVSKQIKQDEFIQQFIMDSTAYTPTLIQKIERFVTNATQYYTCDIAITDENNKVLYYPKKTQLRINEQTLLKSEYQINDELYFIPYNREFIENLYVAIIPFRQKGRVRKIQIEFIPNTVYRNGLYPNLLVDKKQYKLMQGALRYSYAVYHENQLVNMQGNYNYNFQNTILKDTLSPQANRWIKDKNTLHYAYVPAKEKVIIVTRTLPNIFDFFTLTSYMIYAWTLVFVLLSLPYWIKHYSKRKNLRFNLYYRTKIQLYLLFMSLIPLLVIGAVSIPFIKKSYYEEVQRELKRQTQAVLTAIHARGFSEDDFTQSSDAIQSLISDIAILTQSDVNLYSKQGKLIVSTQPKIFELGLLSTNIHPNTYYYLNLQYQQEFIQSEKIGKLSYISIYVPVVDKNLNMTGVLNMPYITRQGQLEAEVARFVSYLIGVYVVILLGLAGLTLLLSNTLTKPLNVLKQRIEQIRLGKKNEPMQWKSNDEIGALVQAYNQMVEKLEASERKLAISEREAAWREMARQIAHEIKNPLTPMKLSIQHLLRAYQDNNPNLNMMIEKVSKTLLTEIDSLTEIATTFSNFAKLQQQEPEVIEIQILLKQNITLYQSHEDIIFDIQLPDEPYFIYADHSAIARTFQNIIKNAIQAMEGRETKILSIHLYKQTDQLYVSIKDTGCGIDKEHLERIFEPNFTTKSSGTGLGLAISKRAIENANGNIYVQSELGKGTTFMIVLPEYAPS